MDWPGPELNLASLIPNACLAFGGLLVAIALLWVAAHWLNAPAWATVEGQVVQARVASDTRTVSRGGSSRTGGGGGTRQETFYRADIVYRYRVGGRDYTGFGIGDGEDWNYGTHDGAASAVARYDQPGVTVWYDPADPERSALDTNIFGIVPPIIGGIGVLLLGLGLRLRWRRRAGAGDIG